MSMLANRKPARKRRPQVRLARLAVPFNEHGQNAVLRLTIDGAATDYFLSKLASDFGTAYQLEKVGDSEGTVYHVNLANEPGQSDSCCCKGFCRWQRCKHVSCLAALRAAGRL